MKFFHYLHGERSGVSHALRILEEKVVTMTLPNLDNEMVRYRLGIDERDQRVLVVIDGDLLWESIPKAGDILLTTEIGKISTNIAHLRKRRCGEDIYSIKLDNKGNFFAEKIITRHFLLLPAGCAVFRRIRDNRLLNPAYVFFEIRKESDGQTEVFWRSTSY